MRRSGEWEGAVSRAEGVEGVSRGADKPYQLKLQLTVVNAYSIAQVRELFFITDANATRYCRV